MVFTGTYEHTIDAKNRLAIPADIRARILEEAGKQAGEPVLLYVTMGENGALCIYTRAMFEKRSAELEQSELEPEKLLPYERLWFSLSRDVELDQQGRLGPFTESLHGRSFKAALGDSLFRVGCREALGNTHFTDWSSAEFRDKLEAATGKDLHDFFEDWVFSGGYADYSVDSMKLIFSPVDAPTIAQVFVKQNHLS